MQTAFKHMFIAIALVSTPTAVMAGGMLKTMPHGTYECVVPGKANGQASIPVAGTNFTLGPASSYQTDKGRGTYILKGKDFYFTRGPKNGERYQRQGDNALRKRDSDGSLGRMVCSRINSQH